MLNKKLKAMKDKYLSLGISEATFYDNYSEEIANSLPQEKFIIDLFKRISELEASLKDLIFHCEDYGIKEESLAILMAVENAHKILNNKGAKNE